MNSINKLRQGGSMGSFMDSDMNQGSFMDPPSGTPSFMDSDMGKASFMGSPSGSSFMDSANTQSGKAGIGSGPIPQTPTFANQQQVLNQAIKDAANNMGGAPDMNSSVSRIMQNNIQAQQVVPEVMKQGSSYNDSTTPDKAKERGSKSLTDAASNIKLGKEPQQEEVTEEVLSEEPVQKKPKEKKELPKLNPKQQKGLIIGAAGVVLFLVVWIALTAVMKNMELKAAEERAKLLEAAWAAELIPFEYTADEVYQLRQAGYTGDEIENFEAMASSAEDLINQAAADRQAQYKEEIAPYLDSASDEFKQLLSDTWVGGADLSWDQDESKFNRYIKTMNVDYKKLPPKGYQLFVEFWLKNGAAVFMSVTPERYAELDETGNMVVQISYTVTADGKQIITDLVEIETE